MRKFIVFAAFFCVSFGISVAATTPAQATTANLPGQEVWVHYYDSAALDQSVGFELVTTCFGPVGSQVGQTSNHYVISSESCNSPTPVHEVECYIDGRLSTCPSDICESGLFDC